ncbi:hypothetical protein [Pseudomonas putida]|uniref:hypothetical protein n=1 Tax=Pseudomonas putida TaxID=303 RepID=UPI000EF67018|nr:hypothetical protein [Pseudomonas putida]AYN12314.1 hypothetical protein CHN49_21630 [Pseudomonas putida]
MLIQLLKEPGGLAINPSHVSSVEVERESAEFISLEIVMQSGVRHKVSHHPKAGVDVYELHRQIVEAAAMKPM